MGVDMERMEVDLQHLLKLQYEGQVQVSIWFPIFKMRDRFKFENDFHRHPTYFMQAVLNLFGKAKVNVNLLLHLLNAKFYGKWLLHISLKWSEVFGVHCTKRIFPISRSTLQSNPLHETNLEKLQIMPLYECNCTTIILKNLCFCTFFHFATPSNAEFQELGRKKAHSHSICKAQLIVNCD